MPLSLSNVAVGPAVNTWSAEIRCRSLFSRLPDETLEAVFLEDILSQKDLCVLAFVSRRFSRMIRASLYSEVTIDLLGEQFTCFSRTLMEHPELASHVWQIFLTYSYHAERFKLEQPFQRKLFLRARQLLELLPALRALAIGNVKCSDGFTSLFDNPMSHLRRISFATDRRSCAIHEVTKAVSFPKIQRLCIWSGWYLLDEDGHLEWMIPARPDTRTLYLENCTALNALANTSPLKELTLRWHSEWIVMNTDLLKIPRALEKLKWECIFPYGRSGSLSPERIIDALSPLYSTLVLLDLTYNSDASGPLADLTCFVRLKILIIDDYLCLERWSSDRPDGRCGFYNRLPPTLEALQVSVWNMMYSLGKSPERAWLTL
jgi:hypothetical protein